MIRNLTYFLCACLFSCGIASADVVHDESIDGDLSTDNTDPTVLIFDLGSNEVLGSTTDSPLDRDIFTFVIGAGQRLDSVILQNYDTTEDQSFFAVEAGSQITSVTDASSLLGSALIGASAGNQEGCLLYTSPSPRDRQKSRMPSSA